LRFEIVVKQLCHFAATLFVAVICAPLAQAANPDEPLDSLDRHFARELTILAEKCESLGLTEQAKLTRQWQVPRHKGRQLLFIPAASEAAKPAANAPDLVQKWFAKFQELRVAQAESLFKIAGECVAENAPTAYSLLHEALRENPDHALARRALGYRRNRANTAWDPYVPAPTASAGETPHPKTSWQQRKYWRIDSKHWRIATNHSAAAGVELAKRLEELHLLWKQTFFDFWCTPADLQAALEHGTPLPEPAIQMNVYLFKSRDEYVKFLLPTYPQIGLTQGFYADEQQTSMFYAGDESIHPTWYHEATHQLFQQWRGTPQGVGEKQNFWLVEGAAMYVESLQNHGTHWTVGGWQADRLQIPRYRALNGDKGLPLQQLVALGREQVQKSPDIRKLYSQSAAEAHFLFDSANPRYQQAGTALLREIYRQNDKLTSLAQLSGASLEELDAGFLKSLQVADDDLLNTPGLARLKNLSLGRTQVTTKGLAALAACTELRWLDLSGLPATDAEIASLKSCNKLDQLFLDGTKITAAALPLIASQFPNLEELDLSNVQISDESLPVLGKLRKLKTLHLTGSSVSPAGVQKLKAVLSRTEIKQ
jgi:hypothetical protein